VIRSALPAETASLVALGESTGIFGPGEADALLRGTLDALHQGELGKDHEVRVWVDPANDVPGGWVYFAPRDGADGAWELFWIGVAPSRHGQGVGDALLRRVEDHVTQAGGTALYIETSSLPALERARRFYERRGYTAVDRSPDHYGIGDDKLTFMKALNVKVEQNEDASPSVSPLAIRAATHSDLASVVRLAMELGAQHEGYDARRFRLTAFGATREALEATYERYFRDELGRDEVALFVADSATLGVVGYVYGRIEGPSFVELCDTTGWIHDVFVDERARGRAVGGRLVKAAIEALRSRGAPEIMLSVSPKNTAGQALFHRLGFATTLLECRLSEP
jgi:ribosomal protein S18 acetylase RimI-like enzyme